MTNICVFCGSGTGVNPQYKSEALQFGAFLAKNNYRIIYGGGNIGLMGAIADAALENGGEVIGVIPDFMIPKEIAHQGLTELKIVESMQVRKKLMAEMSDCFVALPGGFGTLDEVAEMFTFAQLGIQQKPIGLLNTANYFDHFINFVDHMVEEQFVGKWHKELITVSKDFDELLNGLKSYRPRDHNNWFEDHDYIHEMNHKK